MLLEVPVIDIAPFRSGDAAARRSVAAAIGQAVHDIGFLVITGHGVDPALIERAQLVSNAFFNLPLEVKRTVLRPAPDVTRGYIPLEGESVGRSQGLDVPGDLNESFMVGPVDTTDDLYFTAPAAG
jgi:isopenicillin N synthase-like dioxygenase